MFAGPPGTGKTTLAQLVGYAWNNNLSAVPDEITLAECPVTTVGNSAWAPFHCFIGGILLRSSKFGTHCGIFIDTEFEEAGEWKLRPDCLIIDEMNRADLDRCIGELYPLLSKSVERVSPAGIPGIRSIRSDPKFRLIATVNDTTLDDIVFPISEGLARRFIRIELSGATKLELEEFVAQAELMSMTSGVWPHCEPLKCFLRSAKKQKNSPSQKSVIVFHSGLGTFKPSGHGL